MTLGRQILFAVLVLFLLLFVGTFAIVINNTRSYLDDQMRSHAEDTATSLGLSLKPALENEDIPLMETMINAIFDPGYYRRIAVHSPDGSVLIEKNLPVRIAGVPGWFVDLVPLETPGAERELSAGWALAGTIAVTSHPGHAYRELWSVAVETFWWFVGVFMAFSLLLFFTLRLMLRPLRAVEEQALAICDRQFPVHEQIPHTRELKQVVMAMNQMTRRVEQMLADQTELSESMRRQANEDPLTGLSNRRSFDSRLNELLENRESFLTGALFLCQMKAFKEYNERNGFEAGDDLLKEVADILRRVFADEPGSLLARLGGGAFAVVVRDIERPDATSLARRLSDELGRLQSRGFHDDLDVAHTGIAYHQRDESVSELLSCADMALRAAERAGANAWSLYDESTVARADVHTASEWLERLREVLDGRDIVLHYQPVKDRHGGRIVHHEALARIAGEGGEPVPAGVFIPMAERHGLSTDLDKLVVDRALESLVGHPDDVVLAVNLSPASVHDPGFVQWLRRRLDHTPGLGGRLVLESPEYGVMSDLDALGDFLDVLSSKQVGFGVDHFGLETVSFGYLKRFKLSYIKIDGSYIRGIGNTPESQFLVQSVADIAHGLEIKVIAESVETAEEWNLLEKVHVDAGQGYYVGRPDANIRY